MITEITDETFEVETAGSDAPCVILFTAGFCTYCDDMVGALESLSAQYGDTVRFFIANTDQQKGLRIKFAVAAYPYIVYVANQTQTVLFDQVVTEQRLKERIDFMLEGGVAPNTRPLM